MEQYYEQLVERKKGMGARILPVMLGMICLLLLIAVFFVTLLAILPAVIIGVLTWLVFRRSRVEYEYLVMGDSVGVDIIYNRSKRKHLGEYPIESVCLFVPEGAGQLYNYRENKLRDFSSSRSEDKHYVMVCRDGGNNILVKLTPNSRMLEFLEQVLPVGSFVK